MVNRSDNGFDTTCRNKECGSRNIITDHVRGEIFCGMCGEVMADSLPDRTHYDWAHSTGQYMNNARNGPPTSLVMHDRGLATVIGADRDSSGSALPAKSRSKFNRLRVWDKRSKSRSAASLSKAFMMLHAMKAKLAIPDSVVETAAFTYRKAVAANLTRGRTVASLLTASLYVACRQSDTPRTLEDLVAISNIEKKVLFRDLKVMLKRLDITLEPYDRSSFVVKLSNNLGLSERSKRMAVDILRRSEQKMITAGKHPVAMAAASVYVATLLTGEYVTQRTLSKTARVSDVTIRNSVALIRDRLCIKDSLPW